MSYRLEFDSLSHIFQIIKTNLTWKNIIHLIRSNNEICYLSSVILAGIGIAKYFSYNKSNRKFNYVSDIKSGKYYFLEGKVSKY